MGKGIKLRKWNNMSSILYDAVTFTKNAVKV